MSCSFLVQDPFTVASLPRPIDHSGRYVVSDVHGGTPGSRKRKRTELAVGIDGEGLNLYDISSSNLITSYALPPQSAFTCAPCSLRVRKAGKKTATERRTYTSTADDTAKITLFKDNSSADSESQTSTVTHVYPQQKYANPVVFLSTVWNPVAPHRDDLIAVHRDGEINCFHGDDLTLLWTSSAHALGREDVVTGALNNKVVYAQLTDLDSAKRGILRHRSDILATFPDTVEDSRTNTDILILITQPIEVSSTTARTIHVLKLPQDVEIEAGVLSRSVQTLLNMTIPWLHSKEANDIADISYDLHVSSGVLYELTDGVLSTFELTESTAKPQLRLPLDEASSFLRLSNTSVMAASSRSIHVYNTTFKSLQASVHLGVQAVGPGRKRKIDDEQNIPSECKFVSYSSKLNMVHAIRGSHLVAFQIELRNDASRPRPMGRLIDSLGRGVRKFDLGNKNDRALFEKMKDMDACAASHDIEAFERLMSSELHMNRDETELQFFTNTENEEAPHPEVKPFWVHYALRKVFSWVTTPSAREIDVSDPPDDHRLFIKFFPFNVFKYLIDTGNLNRANIESALREDLLTSRTDSIPSGQLIDTLVDIDPTMEMLYSLLSNTYLDAAELVHAIRILMHSLELFGDKGQQSQSLLENGDIEMVNGDVEAEIEEETEAADEDLQLAEFHLSDESNIRVQALSVALARLHSLPSSSVVKALQHGFKTSEIVSLIHLLRFELARGSWTSRYLDATDEDPESVVQDRSIVLITDMLNRCVDAIGAGGWLSGDAMLVNGDHFESEELIASLKLEVSAALEGIEEATYLKGLLAEMVEYGEAMQNTMPHEKSEAGENDQRRRRIGNMPGDVVKMRRDRPIVLAHGNDSTILPLGLKAEQRISLIKIGAGGEVERRSARDIGRLKSRKVGKYSVEKIVL